MAKEVVSRRERLRQATLVEIRSTARRLLVEEGTAAVAINAVAREMGMSGPAVYRYYSSHEALVDALTSDFYRELIAVMEEARNGLADASPGHRLMAMCRAMRAWAVRNPAEFGWVFASPIPSPGACDLRSPAQQAGHAFGKAFLDQVVELWHTGAFPVPGMQDLAPSLREQLQVYSKEIDGVLPPEAVHVFLWCWIRLYGLLCMEVMNQLAFAYTDMQPVFEECLQELCDKLGIPYRPPG